MEEKDPPLYTPFLLGIFLSLPPPLLIRVLMQIHEGECTAIPYCAWRMIIRRVAEYPANVTWLSRERESCHCLLLAMCTCVRVCTRKRDGKGGRKRDRRGRYVGIGMAR